MHWCDLAVQSTVGPVIISSACVCVCLFEVYSWWCFLSFSPSTFVPVSVISREVYPFFALLLFAFFFSAAPIACCTANSHSAPLESSCLFVIVFVFPFLCCLKQVGNQPVICHRLRFAGVGYGVSGGRQRSTWIWGWHQRWWWSRMWMMRPNESIFSRYFLLPFAVWFTFA